MSLHDQVVAALALLPSVLFLLWFLRAASQAPEPPRTVVMAYIAGCAAFGVAVLVLDLLAPLLTSLPGELRMFVAVAPVEETLKVAAILLAAGWPRRWGRMTSGLVYAAAASFGFAAVENIAYAERFGIETGLLRAFTAVPGHALHTALVGIQLGRVHRAEGRSATRGVLLGLLLAIVAHGLYNTLLLEGPAVRMLVVPLLLLEGAIVTALFRRAKAEDLDLIVARLRELPSLQGAPMSSLRMLATRARRRRFTAGDRVFAEGDAAEAVYLVLGGTMKVDRLTEDPHDGDAREELATLNSGSFFGEMGVLMGRDRSASVKAESDALLLELSQTGLHEAIAVVDGLAEELRDSAKDRGAPSARLPTITQLHARAVKLEEDREDQLDPDSLEARLRAVPLLAGLRVEALKLLAAGAFTETRRKRAMLLREGAAGRGLQVILAGQVGVFRGGQQVAELGPGDWFGEISLLTGYAASASVRALTKVELAVVDGSDLRGVIGLVPAMGVELLDGIRERLERDGPERRLPPRPLSKRLIGGIRRIAASAGFARADTRSEEAERLLGAFPALLEAPTGAAETLAALGRASDGSDASSGIFLHADHPELIGTTGWLLPEDCVADALSRSPDLIHLLSRSAARPRLP